MEQSTHLGITTDQAEYVLEQWLGLPTRCSGISRLAGGMLNSVLRLEFDRHPCHAVIKMSSAPDAGFDRERQALDYLSTHTAMRCPAVYGVGEPDAGMPYRYVLMECLPGMTLAAARLDGDDRVAVDRQLAEITLELHSHQRTTFGPVHARTETSDWRDIVVPRLGDMRDEMRGRLPREVLRDIDAALAVAPHAFRDQGAPSLIHGDLWAENVLVDHVDGRWRVTGFVDPGPEYADVEQELAYMQCFDTVGPAFFDVYTKAVPMRPDYERRRHYYWLNTMMIHVWLFGDESYRRRTASIAAALARGR